MKKSQILMSLLLVILLSSCYASRITYENLSIIQRGMSSKDRPARAAQHGESLHRWRSGCPT